jgi:hypothetical protein
LDRHLLELPLYKKVYYITSSKNKVNFNLLTMLSSICHIAFVSGLVVAWNHFLHVTKKNFISSFMRTHGFCGPYTWRNQVCLLIDWLIDWWGSGVIFKVVSLYFWKILKLFQGKGRERFWEYYFTSNFSPLNFISKGKHLIVFQFWKEGDHEVALNFFDSINLSNYLLLGTYFVYKSFKQEKSGETCVVANYRD